MEYNKPIVGLTEVLEEKGIWGRYKIVEASISSTGTITVECGFPPKLIQVKVQSVNEYSNGETDFTTTFSHKMFWTGTAFDTSESTNLISLGSLVGNVVTRLYNGFTFNTSTFSGSAKTVYFTCYS